MLVRAALTFPQEFSVVRFYGDKEKAKAVYEYVFQPYRLATEARRALLITILYRGVEPLTPDDIAEVVVFAATRRENVVIADTLVFPSHQVRKTVPWRHYHQQD